MKSGVRQKSHIGSLSELWEFGPQLGIWEFGPQIPNWGPNSQSSLVSRDFWWISWIFSWIWPTSCRRNSTLQSTLPPLSSPPTAREHQLQGFCIKKWNIHQIGDYSQIPFMKSIKNLDLRTFENLGKPKMESGNVNIPRFPIGIQIPKVRDTGSRFLSDPRFHEYFHEYFWWLPTELILFTGLIVNNLSRKTRLVSSHLN